MQMYSKPESKAWVIDVPQVLCASQDDSLSGQANSLGKVDWSSDLYGDWE